MRPARFDQIGRLLNEGECNPLDAKVETEGQVGAILLGQRREVEHGLGQVNALAVADDPADGDAGLEVIRAAARHGEPDPAIVDQEFLTGSKGREHLGMRERDRVLCALAAAEDEPNGVAALKRKLAVLERADPDFRPLQVLQDADRPAHVLLKTADGRVDSGVIVLRPVAEIQPENIDPRQEQRLEHLGRGARGPHGGDNLGMTITSHSAIRPLWPPLAKPMIRTRSHLL